MLLPPVVPRADSGAAEPGNLDLRTLAESRVPRVYREQLHSPTRGRGTHLGGLAT